MNHDSVLKRFRTEKVLTINEVARLLGNSAVTARRRLRQWNAYTSINRNGRYYVLPEVAMFEDNGLWNYNQIYFSKHGNLRMTIMQLIKQSPAGLTAQQIGGFVGIRANSSFLAGFRDVSEVCREKYRGRFVYFFNQEDIYVEQKKSREALMLRSASLPSDADAVLILVDRIKYPDASIEQCARRLRKRIKHIDTTAIHALLDYHGVVKKTPDTAS